MTPGTRRRSAAPRACTSPCRSLRVAGRCELAGPIVALDPAGEPLGAGPLPPRAVLAFGTERDGLSAALLARAERHVAIPMRAGVSSLNLATAVAVTLYAWRLQAGSGGP